MGGVPEQNIAGQRFGQLTAIRRFNRSGPHIRWLFLCDCGKEVPMFKSNVTRGMIHQCIDCGRSVQATKTTKHGLCEIPEYQIYHAAKDRCENPNNPRFSQYGGRGIRFEFANLEHFLATIGRRPHSGLSLNRIDNDGPYSPKNCEWTTWANQFKSRRPWNWRSKTT
jgi:hypothetical protein